MVCAVKYPRPPASAALLFDADRFLAARSPACRVMHFIQGKKRAILDLLPIFPEDASILAIAYDAPLDEEELSQFFGDAGDRRAVVFWPRSTWAEGRNFAADVGRRGQETFDYIAFLDDDVVFKRGTYQNFIERVLENRPLIAAPITPRSNHPRYVLNQTLQAAALNDEQLLVFHRSALDDPYVWPLVRDYEDVSWHVACAVQQFFIANRFPRRLVQFNEFAVSNDGHVWKDDDVASGYIYERDFSAVLATAYQHVARRLGRSPRHDNEVFRRVRTMSPTKLLQKAYWKHVGRKAWMSSPLDRDGRPLASARG